MTEPAHTPLHSRHVELGARMVDFAGFSMPVQYTSIKEEHAAVRDHAGLFDVSHMGQIHFEGPRAIAHAERLLTARVESLATGRVRYGLLLNENGGCVDDVTIYRESSDSLFLCVNAANIAKDHAWILQYADGTKISNRSAETGLLALQGPKSGPILDSVSRPVSDTQAACDLGRFSFAHYTITGVPVVISRTGYTGSDGFEIYIPSDGLARVFDALLEAGGPQGLVPAGLGARDTLRLEAALPLYGHELDDTTSPLEAGLERFVKRRTGGFIGAEAVEARERAGRIRQLVGFVVQGRGIARAGYALSLEGQTIGRVTSGAPSPSLGKPIGLGYVPPQIATPGTILDVVIRGRAVSIEVAETPFVSKAG